MHLAYWAITSLRGGEGGTGAGMHGGGSSLGGGHGRDIETKAIKFPFSGDPIFTTCDQIYYDLEDGDS